MAVRAVPDGDNHYWVDAAPFRAQLRYLMASASLPAEEVAAAAGISARLAWRLLHGRNGRPLRRISRETACRLIRVSLAQIRLRRPGAETAA